MESGELELRKAFEDVTTNNVKAVLEHNNETRKMLRELELKVEHQNATIRSLNDRIDTQQQQITNLQVKLYTGGSTG